MLPFLQNQRKLPKLRKLAGTSKYGFDEDDELKEHALHELLDAYHAKDPVLLAQAVETLVRIIRNQQDAPDTLEAP
jgi:hypothetical protein